MTESEAIKILQRDLQIQLENKALPDGIEAIQIAMQALEKQIQKKPKINRIDSETIYCKCPSCNITTVLYRNCIMKYCKECGQKLRLEW